MQYAAEALQGTAPYSAAPTVLPVPAALPPAERRRAGRVIRLALGVGEQAISAGGVDPRLLASVFSSSGADGDNCHEICTALIKYLPDYLAKATPQGRTFVFGFSWTVHDPRAATH